MGLGLSAPIQVTFCPIDTCYSLKRGIRHRERSFHLSSTQGGLSPSREDYHLSPCRFRIVSPVCRDKWPAVHIWSTSSLTPFPHNNSGLVIFLLSKGLWVGSINKHLSGFLVNSCFYSRWMSFWRITPIKLFF